MEVGQEIYLEPKNNASRYNKEIETHTISKVGRKYFEVKDKRGRFYIETLAMDGGGYCSDWQAHLSLQDIEDEIEFNSICSDLRKFFTGRIDLSLETLRKIRDMVNR